MVDPIGKWPPPPPFRSPIRPTTAAQELALFLGLPSSVYMPNNAILALQNFTASTNGPVVHITAEYVRVNPRGDAWETLVETKRYELREVTR